MVLMLQLQAGAVFGRYGGLVLRLKFEASRGGMMLLRFLPAVRHSQGRVGDSVVIGILWCEKVPPADAWRVHHAAMPQPRPRF